MKERYRKQKFLKNVGLGPLKNSEKCKTIQENENSINERLSFYYYDDNAQVICRGCYKNFESWICFRLHFNIIKCQITEANYKLNTYNDIYKKYKLRKAKSKKRINDRLSAAQLMDLETLNTRKTRKRCYTNTRVVVNNSNISKSSSDSGSSNSERAVLSKNVKKEAVENCVSQDANFEKMTKSPKPLYKTVKVHDIPNSTKTEIPSLPPDNQTLPSIKTEMIADDISKISSADNQSNSALSFSKDIHKETNAAKYQYMCVVCDERFTSKCLLTMHQVQHIKSDRSCYGVFMAALATRSA